MDAIIEYASTPEGMLIVVGVAFIGIVLLLTALIFWIGSLLRRRGVKIDQTPDTDDETADSSPAADESASQDPLAAFDREAAEQSARAASKAPIALARLRAAGPDITAAAEPKLPEPVLEQNQSVQSAAAPESAPRRLGLCRRSAAADACSCRTGFLGIPGKTAAEGARSARRHSLSPHTPL